jgi:hypothetical protein
MRRWIGAGVLALGLLTGASGQTLEKKAQILHETHNLYTAKLYSESFRQGDLIVLEITPKSEAKRFDICYSLNVGGLSTKSFTVPTIEHNGKLYGLLGSDFQYPEQQVVLNIKVSTDTGEPIHEEHLFNILPRAFETQVLPPTIQHSQPKTKEELSEVAREERELYPSWKGVTLEDYISKGFQKPVPSCNSTYFGAHRFLGKEPITPHKGLDCKAGMNEPVHAALSGKVAQVGKNYFYTGNVAVLDHGLGLFTLYAHLSSATVKQGNEAESLIGKAGKTGRASGPHLHWQAKLYEMNLDPMSLEILNDVFKKTK